MLRVFFKLGSLDDLAVLHSFNVEPEYVASLPEQLLVGLNLIVSEQGEMVVRLSHHLLELSVDYKG